MLSAIQRLNQKFTRVEIVASTNLDLSQLNQSGGHSLNVQKDENDQSIWNVRLLVKLGGEHDNEAPYNGNIEVVGQFRVDPAFPQDKVSDMVHLNAGALLYGAIRELVYSLTSRSLHGEADLPILDARYFIPNKPLASN